MHFDFVWAWAEGQSSGISNINDINILTKDILAEIAI